MILISVVFIHLMFVPFVMYRSGIIFGFLIGKLSQAFGGRVRGYSKWQKSVLFISGCIIVLILLFGDELYGKYRIEQLCYKVRQAVPATATKSLKNKELDAITYDAPDIGDDIIRISLTKYELIDHKTKKVLYKGYQYQFYAGLFVRVLSFDKTPILYPYTRTSCYHKNIEKINDKINIVNDPYTYKLIYPYKIDSFF